MMSFLLSLCCRTSRRAPLLACMAWHAWHAWYDHGMAKEHGHGHGHSICNMSLGLVGLGYGPQHVMYGKHGHRPKLGLGGQASMESMAMGQSWPWWPSKESTSTRDSTSMRGQPASQQRDSRRESRGQCHVAASPPIAEERERESAFSVIPAFLTCHMSKSDCMLSSAATCQNPIECFILRKHLDV